jgi:ATP-dependent helicase HrpA
VPVPDYVDKILLQVKAQDRPLTEVLAEQLKRHTGIAIKQQDWNVQALDPWYLMNFVLQDEAGKTIAMARNLDQLQRDFKQQISAGLEQAAENSLSRQNIVAWDFAELPEAIELQRGNINIKAWPALKDYGESVAIEVMDNPMTAANVSRMGQLRLAILKGREQHKYLTKNLLRGTELALKAAAIGSRQQISEALINASFQEAIFSTGDLVRDQASFEHCFESGIGNVVGIAQQHADNIESVLPRLHEIHKCLRALGLSAIYAKQDVINQFNWLFSHATLSTVTLEHTRQYPRFVRGVSIRLEKLASQVDKDRRYIAEVEALLKPVIELDRQQFSMEIAEAINAFLWLVEEYRISLFAQQLKTRVPVSAKRLDKRWTELSDQLRRF